MSLKITAQQQVTVENTRQPRLKQRCVQKSRNILKYILWICFTAHRYILGTKGIHQAGPTRTQNGKMEPCGNYIMHTLGQLWGYIVLTVFTLHVHSHVLSAWCKGIVWTNRHSSCQPLRLGLVWIAIEFELISFQVKLFDCCWSNWQIGCWAAFEPHAKYISTAAKIFWWEKAFLVGNQEYFVDKQDFATFCISSENLQLQQTCSVYTLIIDMHTLFMNPHLCLQCSE